uniref:Uncharacterized protein n=1 Tax=Moumouvirus sp. 'Monve' TaxID=1128131 RepID=H2EG29_9VIRU|nr:hypothetical protein mv_R1150 [Moumouvirus Monve]
MIELIYYKCIINYLSYDRIIVRLEDKVITVLYIISALSIILIKNNI